MSPSSIYWISFESMELLASLLKHGIIRDDPFSAADAHTATSLFNVIICRLCYYFIMSLFDYVMFR